MKRWLIILAVVLIAAMALGAPPVSLPAPPASPITPAAPDVVTLDELVDRYEPVPFDHKTHASMAEMWRGCETCHHRSPITAATQPADLASNGKTQADAGRVPACKECHEVRSENVAIGMPNLKGAYHRQCLNCHREWTGENACSACHQERKHGRGEQRQARPPPPTVDDIVGRMHPPIPEPVDHTYVARITPAVGELVHFRHKEHTERYGLKCVSCHHEDNCANCHNGHDKTIADKPLQPGRTWKQSHGPCVSCHVQQNCRHCHYDEGGSPPPAFDHRLTGQELDADHVHLRCGECHLKLRSKTDITCGPAACHAERPAIAFPVERPGPMVATHRASAATQVAAAVKPQVVDIEPTTRPIVRRIRRGGR